MQTKNEIKVFFANEKPADVQEASTFLNSLQKHSIDCVSWTAYPYKPFVSFSISYTHEALLLKYYVEEKFIRAEVRTINGEVYKDSCVEVFLSFDQKQYYNLEFNSLGIALVGHGQQRANRSFLPEQVIKQISCQTASYKKNDETAWELTLVIPFSVFIYDRLDTFGGKTITGNFYKCGDETLEPHFLSWSPIESPEPDFHLPQFFGKISFI
jgi:hypothetical protein